MSFLNFSVHIHNNASLDMIRRTFHGENVCFVLYSEKSILDALLFLKIYYICTNYAGTF